jgi:hypothetical protein
MLHEAKSLRLACCNLFLVYLPPTLPAGQGTADVIIDDFAVGNCVCCADDDVKCCKYKLDTCHRMIICREVVTNH